MFTPSSGCNFTGIKIGSADSISVRMLYNQSPMPPPDVTSIIVISSGTAPIVARFSSRLFVSPTAARAASTRAASAACVAAIIPAVTNPIAPAIAIIDNATGFVTAAAMKEALIASSAITTCPSATVSVTAPAVAASKMPVKACIVPPPSFTDLNSPVTISSSGLMACSSGSIDSARN